MHKHECFWRSVDFPREEIFQQFLEQTPFGVFYELSHIKIQCQLLRHLLLLETENVRDDMFIVKINGTVLRLLTNFVSYPSIPNRLIQKYFGEMTKDPKLDFLNKFKEANFFEPEDRFKIGVMYFISTFLTGSEAYLNCILIWLSLVSMLTLKACSRRLGNNPTLFKFSQFHFALQIWFCECCHPFDNIVAIHVANGTPCILNWKTLNESIFSDDLKNTIFRTYGNQNNLHEYSSHHETKNQATSERNDVDFDEKYVELKKKIAEDDAHQHVEETEKARMDQPSVSMREYIDSSNINVEAHYSIDQTVGGVLNADIPGSSTSKPPTLDDYPDLTMTQIVELDLILNVTTTPDLKPRNRNPGKYDTSLYIRLSEGESSVRRGPIFSHIKHQFESHNGFEVAAELIDDQFFLNTIQIMRLQCFFLYIFNVHMKSAYSKVKDKFEPQMDFGVVKVSAMDFFNIMIKTGRP
ncbi:hypothetical protein R3W88_008402 [Solanum pinnatisectum]|uniref:Uncharacterized protein n=1 Tax=Solanum pinnatisectum TaxID=50273 RepID=A0AAV9M7Y7_9SOLN|nr:hypothetical protein R3W88_008402 [Solanum pinnatisectum]